MRGRNRLNESSEERADEEIEESNRERGGDIEIGKRGGERSCKFVEGLSVLEESEWGERERERRGWRLAAISWNDAESNCVT